MGPLTDLVRFALDVTGLFVLLGVAVFAIWFNAYLRDNHGMATRMLEHIKRAWKSPEMRAQVRSVCVEARGSLSISKRRADRRARKRAKAIESFDVVVHQAEEMSSVS